MKLQDFPNGYFVVLRPDHSSLLLLKNISGTVRKASNYELTEVDPDTEIQPITFKESAGGK